MFTNPLSWKRSTQVIVVIAVVLLVLYAFCLPRQLFNVPYSTVVEDRGGELLGARIAEDGQWRFPVCDTVPDKFKTCIIHFEDRYFYYHWGVNPLAIGRALSQNIKEKRVVSGGSTLTMQTIRLARNKNRTVWEKLIEAVWATRLEFRCSKKEILALYASHAPFGGNVVGLEAAAWRYFGRSADQLSWAEAATLAVLPNAPAMIHLSKNRQQLLRKRNLLLHRLHERGVIDEVDYTLALGEELPGEPLPLPQIAPHLVTYFHQQHKGERITSTIDIGMQVKVERLLVRWNRDFSRSDINNIAAMVIDVDNNKVVSYCGNVNFADDKAANQVDILRSPRSTGSIWKPLLYYAALQDGEILPHTLLADIPVSLNGFNPQNFSLRYDGAVPASQVISRSLNIPSVLLLRDYGVAKFYDFLKQAGFTTLTRPSAHYGLSLILGGAEAMPWEVATIYAEMARSLRGLEPTKSQINNRVKPEVVARVFKPEGVWQVFEAIKEVNRPEEIDWRDIPSMQTIAWKTGTSYGFRDAWAVGVTPKFVVAVWVGNASGEGKPGLVGARTAGPVMFDIFNMLPTSPWFSMPDGDFAAAEVCRQSGHLKNRFCDEVDTVFICANGLRSEPCPYHVPVHLTIDGRNRVYEHCAGEFGAVQRSWFVLPPAWEWYYKQQHPGYKVLPPFKTGCDDGAQSIMQFIYPQHNARISLPRQLDGSPGKVTFDLAHRNNAATVFWHIDEEYVTATRDFHQLTVALAAGEHYVTVVDGEGRVLSVRIFVE
ncbi:penicillin-binding protein 1C [Bacteroidales bacterium OttesenSCG-928-B11]|nr:penicillin-binding protein 1C [Bacteroidales bacterium OttesenSCG-928-E04]MDL2311334.1 penicillin-binding protein 1C [Bacteroidales bacterium OttesenSCG-928-B11]